MAAPSTTTGRTHSVMTKGEKSDSHRLDPQGNINLVKVNSGSKIGSDHNELFLKLVPTAKIIDKIRDPWGFEGTLVKFKLQVGMSDQELLRIAGESREHSLADYIVANCLEWCAERAYTRVV